MSTRNLIIFILGVVYVLTLIGLVKDEYFYSGDGGIKTLMIKEYIAGDWNKTLDLQRPDWANELWNEGLYPFRKPFVYETPEGKITGFPPYFSVISTPFYKWFGFRGLYILPALSLFALWIVFIRLGRKLQVSDVSISLGLAALVFGSSLTLYGSIFWEHTLASACCFLGLYYLVSSHNEVGTTRLPGWLCGLIAGFAVWLRPEALFVLIFFLAWSVYFYAKFRSRAYLFFLGGSVLAIAGFLFVNYTLYESLTGFHSKQVVEGVTLTERIVKGVYTFAVLIAKAVLFDPLSVFVLIASTLFLKTIYSNIRNNPGIAAIVLSGILFFYFSSTWIFPNTGGLNWGIRYALVCTPFFYVLGMLLLDKVKDASYGRYLIPLAWVLVAGGILQNTFRGSKSIYDNYGGYKTEVLAYFKKNPTPVLLISNSNHSAELEALMASTTFLLTEDRAHLDLFLNTAIPQQTDVMLLFEPGDGYGKAGLAEEDLTQFQPVQKIGNITLYKLTSGSQALSAD